MSKKEIRNTYDKWVEETGYEPKSALVRMYWEDEMPEDLRVDTIALSTYDIDTEDEDVLFYASGIDGLLELTEPGNGSDFVVTEVLEFA